uniref:DUF4430 domain-containing protein n=1 Tax=candidate division WOR-3 bacterium TaxID=2052148 RepID=A0A7C2K4M4_UNCW3
MRGLAFLKNKWALAAMGILCWAIAASLVSGYYYYQYNDLVTRLEGAKATINLGVDYGNGTRVWYNGTKGLTLYDAMLNAGWNIDGKSYGVMGMYIKAINGLEESNSNFRYWGWWSWTDFGWAHGGSACDKYVVSPGETILWYYSPTDPNTFEMAPPP